MRRTAIILNSVGAVFFACFVAYTFVARDHLEDLARGFVTEKTVQHSEPIVDAADEFLDEPLVRTLLDDRQMATIRDEIAEYRADPPAYVARLTRGRVRVEKAEPRNPLLARVASTKDRIRAYYDETLDELVFDLKLFAVSNLVAVVLALGLAIGARDADAEKLGSFSIVMFLTTLYAAWIYVDGLSFFRILFRTHMGWWYPALLAVVLVGLCVDRFRQTRRAPRVAETVNPSRP